MKTTKEMIEVMQAFERGERIEAKALNNDIYGWDETKEPFWDWHNLDYRVKPKKSYVPFDTPEEFLAAQLMHGDTVLTDNGYYCAYVSAHNDVRLVGVTRGDTYATSFEGLLETCKFIDCTPCGKEVQL